MKTHVIFSLLISVFFFFSLAARAEDTYSLRLIGEYTIKTKTMFDGEEFGGISAIDRLPNGDFLALSDERGGGHGSPRLYSLSIKLDGESIKEVVINKMVYLKDQNGEKFPSNKPTIDPEGLRMAPNGNLYISSEGNWSEEVSDRHQPLIAEIRTDGSFVRLIETPPKFNYIDNKTLGGRDNKVFESVAVAPDGHIYTANEDALIEDGEPTSSSAGTVVRIVKIDPYSDFPPKEYAYKLPKIPLNGTNGGRYPPGNGLVELLALSDNELIAVERAYADGIGMAVNLVKTKIEKNTTDISDLMSLRDREYKPLEREVLLSMPVRYQGVKIDNIEGITWGPALNNGSRTLILVSDNNFDDTQVTQFLAFEFMKNL